jgi:hypothetical protein
LKDIVVEEEEEGKITVVYNDKYAIWSWRQWNGYGIKKGSHSFWSK